MNSRNFKVRIENLNLKKTVFLETAKHASSLMIKYRDMINKLGYTYVRSSRQRHGKHQIYYFYSNEIFPTSRDYSRKFPRIQRRFGRMGFVKHQDNEYLVQLHIIQMNVKHTPE